LGAFEEATNENTTKYKVLNQAKEIELTLSKEMILSIPERPTITCRQGHKTLISDLGP